MKISTPAFLLCVVLGFSANAQKLSLLPQVGLESSKTSFQFNNLPSIFPKNAQIAPRLGLRMDYAFKKIGGPYVGLSTSRSVVNVNLAEPENGRNITSANIGSTQLRLEGGYQYSSKPIYFGKSKPAPKAAVVAPQHRLNSYSGSRCGGGYCSRNRSESYRSRSIPAPPVPQEKGWYVSLQPAAGLAYIPSAKTTITTQTTGGKSAVSYLAGNMTTAFVAGTGLEFGKNTDRKFNIAVQYVKGIGNDKSAVSTLSGSKSVTTSLSSAVSSWNVSLGIPISLSRKKAEVKPVVTEPIKKEQKVNTERRCGGYRSSYIIGI